jgi:CARDB
MSRPIATTPRTVVFATGTVVLAAPCFPFAAPARPRAHPRARPDLVERAIRSPPMRLVPGGSFRVGDTVLNRGRTRSNRSSTRYYLRAGRVTLLVGARRIPRLGVHRTSVGHAVLRAPAVAHAGRYSLVVCADATRSIRESNERNNCRTARLRVAVSPIMTGGPPRLDRELDRDRLPMGPTPTGTAFPTTSTARHATPASIRACPTRPT